VKSIPLTRGYEAIVDDEDYAELSKHKWRAMACRVVYAGRSSKVGEGGKRHLILMHRVVNNTPVGMETDHINGNGVDNRKSNLRTASRVQNARNMPPYSGGTSRYKGVSWVKRERKWYAKITVNKKSIGLGYYADEARAAAAYAERAKLEFGEFARVSL
jgi:hypothetical protein